MPVWRSVCDELACRPRNLADGAAGRLQRTHGAARRGQRPGGGKLALTQYACHACHPIPGITGSEVYVGAVLKGYAGRRIIARDLPGTPENLARWIRDPQEIDPHTAMPALGVGEKDARDMVAYLLTLK
jgi:cytochrome c2